MSGTDPSALVITFGKHRGATVAELLAQDPQYAQWLLGQAWLADRFAELHAALLRRGAASDDTPEHNTIQARFLDPLFRAAFIQLTQDLEAAQQDDWERRITAPQFNLERAQQELEHLDRRLNSSSAFNDPTDNFTKSLQASRANLANKVANAQAAVAAIQPLSLQSSATFEQRGVDVLLTWGFITNPHRIISIEIKPTMGDDYPAVMRQMQRLNCQYLLIQTYTGAAVPLPTLRSMFIANRNTLLTIADVETAIPGARLLLENPKP